MKANTIQRTNKNKWTLYKSQKLAHISTGHVALLCEEMQPIGWVGGFCLTNASYLLTINLLLKQQRFLRECAITSWHQEHGTIKPCFHSNLHHLHLSKYNINRQFQKIILKCLIITNVTIDTFRQAINEFRGTWAALKKVSFQNGFCHFSLLFETCLILV